MQPNTRLNKGDCDKNPAPDFHRRYHGIFGSLGYLVTMTRPDVAWAYSEPSKYVQFPGENHMFAARHVLFYHRGTWNQTIRYSRDFHENPKVSDTRRSDMGYVLMINGGPSSWKSQRQDNVSFSTPEVEFVAVSQAGQEAIYLRETLTDFGYSHTKATLLCEEIFPALL